MSEPLPTIGYISHIVADALRDPTSGINTTQLRAEPNGCVSEPLVFRSDALAKLAEKDAEIEEEQRISNLRADAVERWTNTCAQQDEIIDGLRAEIAWLREYYEASEALNKVGLFNATPEMFEREQRACKALKGPEA